MICAAAEQIDAAAARLQPRSLRATNLSYVGAASFAARRSLVRITAETVSQYADVVTEGIRRSGKRGQSPVAPGICQRRARIGKEYDNSGEAGC